MDKFQRYLGDPKDQLDIRSKGEEGIYDSFVEAMDDALESIDETDS